MRRDVTTISFGGVLLALVAFLWWESTRQELTVLGNGIAYDPLFFPRLLLILGALCGVGIVIDGLLGRSSRKASDIRWGLWIAISVLIGLFFWAIGALGFPVSAFLFVLAFCALLGYRRWIVVPVVALLVSLGVWYVFTAWLQVPLPATPWLEGIL